MSRFEKRALRQKGYLVERQQIRIARGAAKVTKLRQSNLERVSQPHLAKFAPA
jgi:hypothetical protein|tara:strand:+ start:280 stop:438 length:159 start_codon:yes stop_codon:yes gene_type:complete